jgi:hypothetical protein
LTNTKTCSSELERSRSTPGRGLGLSPATSVAQLPGARIAMTSNEPRLLAKLIADTTT